MQYSAVRIDHLRRLNESPSEKEGKLQPRVVDELVEDASMKVPPKRKGNEQSESR